MLFHLPKAPPPSSSPRCKSQFHLPHLSLPCEQKPSHNSKPNKAQADRYRPNMLSSLSKIPSMAIQAGAILSTMVMPPAFAVTGVNDEDDLIWVLVQSAIAAFFYFLIAPVSFFWQ